MASKKLGFREFGRKARGSVPKRTVSLWMRSGKGQTVQCPDIWVLENGLRFAYEMAAEGITVEVRDRDGEKLVKVARPGDMTSWCPPKSSQGLRTLAAAGR